MRMNLDPLVSPARVLLNIRLPDFLLRQHLLRCRVQNQAVLEMVLRMISMIDIIQDQDLRRLLVMRNSLCYIQMQTN